MPMPRFARTTKWDVAPVAVGIACIVVSFFVPTNIGNYLAVFGVCVTVATFTSATRRLRIERRAREQRDRVDRSGHLDRMGWRPPW